MQELWDLSGTRRHLKACRHAYRCRGEAEGAEERFAIQGEEAAKEKQMADKPQATDPQAGKSESANLGEHWLGETKAARNRLLHAIPGPEGEMEAPHRTKNECRIARVLKDGTEFLTLYEVRRAIRITGEAAKGSLEVIDLFDAKVQEFTEYNWGADQDKIHHQAVTVVLEFEEALQQQRAAEEQQTAADEYELAKCPRGGLELLTPEQTR
jgi:hypothetical protein